MVFWIIVIGIVLFNIIFILFLCSTFRISSIESEQERNIENKIKEEEKNKLLNKKDI